MYMSGEVSPVKAIYMWHQNADGSTDPEPQEEERYVTLGTGDLLPEVSSSRRRAFWVMVRYCL